MEYFQYHLKKYKSKILMINQDKLTYDKFLICDELKTNLKYKGICPGSIFLWGKLSKLG